MPSRIVAVISLNGYHGKQKKHTERMLTSNVFFIAGALYR